MQDWKGIDFLSRIFGYIGSDDCRDIVLDVVNSWDGDTVAFAVKNDDELMSVKDKNELDMECKTLLSEVANSVRAKASSIVSPPACNNLFAVAMDGYIDKFDILRSKTGNPFPIITDEDLLLAMLCVEDMDNKIDLMISVDSRLAGNPTYAFFCKDDSSIFCKKGNAPLYVGIAKSGYYISSEIEPLCNVSLRYFALSDGDYLKLSKDKAMVFDSKKHKLKRNPIPLPEISTTRDEFVLDDEVFYCALTVKSIVKAFVNKDTLTIPNVRLGRHSIDRLSRIIITGSGENYYPAIIGAHNFGLFTDVPTYAVPSGELLCSTHHFDKYTLLIAVCENGEDMDTITAVKRAKSSSARVIGITNNSHSYLAQICKEVINPADDFNSSKMSLRGFISSYLALSFLALYIGNRSDVVSELYFSVVLKMAESLSGKVSSSVKSSSQLKLGADMLCGASRIVTTGYLGDNALGMEAGYRMRTIMGMESINCQLDMIEDTFGAELRNTLILAFVSDNRYLPVILRYLRRLRSIGARVVIYTDTNIEDEMMDFDYVISVNDSVPLLNPVPIISSFYKTIALANENYSSLEAV